MQVAVKALLGLAGVPSHRTSASNWLKKAGVTIVSAKGPGGNYEAAYLSNLPEDVRRAYLLKHIEGEDLDPGSYDDAAHGAFLRACRGRRDRAERKAEVARFLIALGPQVKWKDRLHLVHAKFGVKGHSQHRLIALLRQVSGVEAFDYLATSISCGHLSGDDASLGVLLRMAARALKAAEKEEIAALELVEMKLRVAQLRSNGGVVKCT